MKLIETKVDSIIFLLQEENTQELVDIAGPSQESSNINQTSYISSYPIDKSKELHKSVLKIRSKIEDDLLIYLGSMNWLG